MTTAGRNLPGLVKGLAWLLAFVILIAVAGFGALGAWSVAHWPWRQWAADERARQAPAEDAAQVPKRVVLPPPSAPLLPSEPYVGPNGEKITNPSWVVRPQGAYPRAALERGIDSGAVVLECEVLSTGEMGVCEIVSETPSGYGFGDAAVAGTRVARLKPRSVDGFQTDSTVRFTIRFRLQ